MTLGDSYEKLGTEVARNTLRGAARAYLFDNLRRTVWRSRMPAAPGYLISTDNDHNAFGQQFKRFLPEGVHMGWGSATPPDGQLAFVRSNGEALVSGGPPIPASREPISAVQTYAAGLCRWCNQVHAPDRWILESGATRFKLLRFAAELSAMPTDFMQEQERHIKREGDRVEIPKNPDKAAHKVALKQAKESTERRAIGLVQSIRFTPQTVLEPNLQLTVKVPLYETPTMLGLLICGVGADAKTYVAASGKFADGRFKHVARLHGFTVCEKVPVQRSLAGKPIPGDIYQGSKALHAQMPGTCAAPRMIAQAIADKCMAPLDTWRMSEIYYWRRGMKDNGELAWVPGLTAHSCETCEKLLPLFLCANT
jgi:hypothetical protein